MIRKKLLITVLILLSILIPYIAYASTYETRTQNVTQTIKLLPAKAFIYYSSNTGINLTSAPKEMMFNEKGWKIHENELTTAGSTLRWMRAASCPISLRSHERILVTLSADAYLDAYVWNGSSWLVTNNIGQVNSGASPYQAFDIAYETSRGNAVLVYALSSSNSTMDLAYRIWNGVFWSNEYYINDPTQSSNLNYRWIELESNPLSSSNEIGLIAVDQTNADCNAWIWDGTQWGNFQELENALSGIRDNKCISLAYEQISGKAMFGWCYSTDIQFRRWNGTSWESELPSISISTLNVRWVALKADPQSNKILALTIDGQNDLNTVLWNGSAWGAPLEHDDDVTNIDSRCADYEWEPSGSKGLLVWSTSQDSISYKTFTIPDIWGSPSTVANPSGHPWIQLRRNHRFAYTGEPMIIGATLNGNNDLFGLTWDGNILRYESSAFTDDTGTRSYECFDILTLQVIR